MFEQGRGRFGCVEIGCDSELAIWNQITSSLHSIDASK